MSGFLNDELSKRTTVFGLRLWVVLGFCLGAAFVLLLFIISVWLTSRRNVKKKITSVLPHAIPAVSKEIQEIRVDPPSRAMSENPKNSVDTAHDPVPEPEYLGKDTQKSGGDRMIHGGNGKGRRSSYSERVGSCDGSEKLGSGDQPVPEVSHLGWGHWYTLRELEVSTNGFSVENVIGEGGYGIVYYGVLEDNTIIAVKNLLNNRGQAEKEFKVEVEAIGRIRHKNLVRLLGFCVEGAHRMLVYEYVDNGNLEQWLHGDVGPHSPLTWEIRMNIVLGVAKGLSYLHDGLEPKVIHRDIKSSNILLDKQWNPKLSDFGLAKLLGSEKSYITTRVMGTFGSVIACFLQLEKGR
ncbi:unnamed protein product [Cuscuta epithymum]|uniref:non-specific serine/threonine protein kinase n=1 Tax=Cuscuta epithymum TaxID=186058 RepID=A0AAV0E1G8_9ASTE|nr:unnamed protein product [Cuscuta epithymum]